MTRRHRRPILSRLALAPLLSVLLLVAGEALAGSAVAFMYHRFGDDRYPSTNIRMDQFEAHLREIRTGNYVVLPLPRIVEALATGAALPDRTLAITIDDAFRSVYTEAFPRLRAAGLPFTLFVATDTIDERADGLNWTQIREMHAAGVTIGHHTASHAHLADLSSQAVQDELARANARFREELGHVPTLFAYPYGEYSSRVRKLIEEAGFAAAFGQHSGVMHAEEDRFALPRFALNERYGDLDRFRLAANALPLPVRNVLPEDPLIGSDNPPSFGFSLAPAVDALVGLGCYASSQAGPARIERLGPRRFEIRLDKPLPYGRSRINCTAPAGAGRWHWYGRQFYRPGKGE